MITEQQMFDAATETVSKSPRGAGYIAGFMDGATWMQEQDQWISVEDRFPEEGQRVNFVVDYLGNHRHGKVYGGVYTGFFDGVYKNEFSTPGWGITASCWKPAPEPPKKEYKK